MAHKNRAGKLKRPTLIPKSSKTNLAIRGDIWDIGDSPVKGNYALPENVNQKPLKVVKKKKQTAGKRGGDPPVLLDPQVRSADEPDSNQGVPAENPTPPLRIDPSGSNVTRASGSNETEASLRTAEAHANTPAIEEVRPRQKRKSASLHEEEQPAKSPRRRRQATHVSRLTETSQESEPAPRDFSDDEDPDYQPDAEKDESATLPDAEITPVVERATSIEPGFRSLDIQERHTSIETVLRFLDIEERPGSCLTESARSLIRRCKKSCERVQDENTSADTIVKDSAEIQEKLKSFSSTVSEEHRPTFKSDAYGHVFHSLAAYLGALHNWLLRTYESVTESLEALRIVTPLLRAILLFKDTINEWNGTVPPRYKGDRPCKDVQSHLIKPLRQVEEAFRVRLSQLEAVERRSSRGMETSRRMEEQMEAEHARIEANEAMQERKKRWQSLHIVRMQCEPDIYRRRKLFHTSFEDLVERDANGVVFERLPLFKSRSAPPHSRISEIADETEWTEKEETAVLEGLQQYAGESSNLMLLGMLLQLLTRDLGRYVFEKMFQMYCDPRSPHPRAGDLRDRSVAEIISKASWIRSAMLILCQETNVPAEKWVKKIPVLP